MADYILRSLVTIVFSIIILGVFVVVGNLLMGRMPEGYEMFALALIASTWAGEWNDGRS